MELCGFGSVKAMNSETDSELQEKRLQSAERKMLTKKRFPLLPPAPTLSANMEAMFNSYADEDFPPIISAHSWTRAKPFKVIPMPKLRNHSHSLLI